METDNENGNGSVKIGTVKWVGSMLLAGVVSYLGTTYGMQARIDVITATKAADSAQLTRLTDKVDALNEKVSALAAAVARIEGQRNVGRR